MHIPIPTPCHPPHCHNRHDDGTPHRGPHTRSPINPQLTAKMRKRNRICRECQRVEVRIVQSVGAIETYDARQEGPGAEGAGGERSYVVGMGRDAGRRFVGGRGGRSGERVQARVQVNGAIRLDGVEERKE